MSSPDLTTIEAARAPGFLLHVPGMVWVHLYSGGKYNSSEKGRSHQGLPECGLMKLNPAWGWTGSVMLSSSWVLESQENDSVPLNLSFSLHKLDVQRCMLPWSVLGKEDRTTQVGGE